MTWATVWHGISKPLIWGDCCQDGAEANHKLIPDNVSPARIIEYANLRKKVLTINKLQSWKLEKGVTIDAILPSHIEWSYHTSKLVFVSPANIVFCVWTSTTHLFMQSHGKCMVTQSGAVYTKTIWRYNNMSSTLDIQNGSRSQSVKW